MDVWGDDIEVQYHWGFHSVHSNVLFASPRSAVRAAAMWYVPWYDMDWHRILDSPKYAEYLAAVDAFEWPADETRTSLQLFGPLDPPTPWTRRLREAQGAIFRAIHGDPKPRDNEDVEYTPPAELDTRPRIVGVRLGLTARDVHDGLVALAPDVTRLGPLVETQFRRVEALWRARAAGQVPAPLRGDGDRAYVVLAATRLPPLNDEWRPGRALSGGVFASRRDAFGAALVSELNACSFTDSSWVDYVSVQLRILEHLCAEGPAARMVTPAWCPPEEEDRFLFRKTITEHPELDGDPTFDGEPEWDAELRDAARRAFGIRPEGFTLYCTLDLCTWTSDEAAEELVGRERARILSERDCE